MSIFLFFVLFLFSLAVVDLMVGVSNDAVNFLNSAIGAKVASFKTIIIVAAVGVFIGATMSNGMMEIARHGIFHPAMFSFKELMFIFLSVMISDVILLDIFNNLGLPTSTTVSMVFELLGGTTIFAIMKMHGDQTGLGLGDLMNTEKAIEVIFGIFISVPIAFFFGSIIQYLSRLLFTFTYSCNNMKWKIGIFGGIAATAIVYFMIFKGIKGMSFISSGTMGYIEANTPMLMGICFIASTLIMQGLYFLKVDVFKILVLLGTFALAMAFAGNDLVNFIGVPLAGYASYQDFMAHPGADPSSFMMASLDSPAKTPVIFLILAGIVMVISLATSKKARNVIKTSVDLSRQSEGDEMFGSSRIARVLVRFSDSVSNFFSDVFPDNVKAWANKRFDASDIQLRNGAAFDEVRATVNLVVASLLIALGTSWKLPLSTTYVTFMVAMGTSLADKAWGRESAVYRITGVISVIGGWFITAGAAFILCFTVAWLINLGGFLAACLFICMAAFLLIRSSVKYRKRQQEEKGDVVFNELMRSTDKEEVLKLLTKHVNSTQCNFLEYVNTTYKQITDAFIAEKLGPLRSANETLRRKREELKNTRRKEMVGLRRIDADIAMEKSTWFHLGRNSCEEILYCLRRIVDPCEEHVDNHFMPMSKEQVKEFIPLRDTVLFLLKRASEILRSGSYDQVEEVRHQGEELKVCLEQTRDKQMMRMQTSKENIAVGYLYLNILQETREIASSVRHLLRSAKGFNEGN